MNWNKGKNTLIILFLSINILLGWANYRKDTTSYVLKEAQVQDIINLLEANNIFLEVPIPKRYSPLAGLTVAPFQYDSSTRDQLIKQLLGTSHGVTVSIESAKSPNEKPRRIYRQEDQEVIFEGEKVIFRDEAIDDTQMLEASPMSINEGQKLANKWLSEKDFSPKKMHMQVVDDSKDLTLIYYDKYGGTPVFDSYIKFHITPSGIKEVEIHKVVLGEISGEKKEIYSIDQVFFYLIKSMATDQPTYIKDIIMGYALENPKGTHLIAEKAIPFYQIILEDGRTYYINAYTSEIREEMRI